MEHQNGEIGHSLRNRLNEVVNTPRDDGDSQPEVMEQRGAKSLFEFLWSELNRGYALANDEARYIEKRRKVYALLRIPRELESFLFCGFLQCADAFLYIFTFLPLRFVMALSHLFRRLSASVSEWCDLLKVFILATSILLMNFIDTSVLYHIVRGQAIIKLYIFFNMLEVADKLFSSFGQDILDALVWTATETQPSQPCRRKYYRLSVHLVVAILYVTLHAILILLQATTLNVAFNSHNKALLTIMMSNNFVELKGSVFKKFAKNNLFQMACSDVRERFHYVVLLLIIVTRNMSAVNWHVEHFYEMLPDVLLVFIAEILVDWVKHAFITKFNEIPADVYKDFTITIAYDVAKSRQANAYSDHCDQVSRRMGFTPLPLSVLLFRIVNQSLRIDLTVHWPIVLSAFVTLLLLKLLISVVMMGKAAIFIEAYEEMLKQSELLNKLCHKKAHSLPVSPKLSLIEFTDVMQQNAGANFSHCFTVTDLVQKGAAWPEALGGAGHLTEPSIREAEFSIGESVVRKSRSMTSLSSDKNVGSSGEADQMTEFEELLEVDRYTLCNNDRIES
uniref:Eukaryotic membrane protein n=1 Tax=Trichuris muris TaxID=70415 RepID=A0A5S6R3U6_TRIMR